MTSLLEIRNLQVKVEDKVALNTVNMLIERGEVCGLTGKNGSGKSSLANTLLGSGQYKVLGGSILFDGKNLLEMSVDERARAGLYVAWQNPLSIPGVGVFTLMRESAHAHGKKIGSLVELRAEVEEVMGRVGLSKDHLKRSVNEGFSGGERKRLELAQMIMIKPKLVVLDEIDSGMDGEGRQMVGEIVREMAREGTSFVVISHYSDLLLEVKAEKIWAMKEGRVMEQGIDAKG